MNSNITTMHNDCTVSNTLDHDNCDHRAHYEDRIGRPDRTDNMIMLYAVRPN